MVFDQLRQNAINNFENFKAELLNSTTNVVFDSAYQIYAYNSLLNFFRTPEFYLTEELAKFLLTERDKVLDFLFECIEFSLVDPDPACAVDVQEIIEYEYRMSQYDKYFFNEEQNELQQ